MSKQVFINNIQTTAYSMFTVPTGFVLFDACYQDMDTVQYYQLEVMTKYECLLSCPVFWIVGVRNGKPFNQCINNCSSTNPEFSATLNAANLLTKQCVSCSNVQILTLVGNIKQCYDICPQFQIKLNPSYNVLDCTSNKTCEFYQISVPFQLCYNQHCSLINSGQLSPLDESY